jgi:hypothetical protein
LSEDEIKAEVDRYLRTGDTDLIYAAWPGSFMERAKRAHRELREALIAKVNQRTAGRCQELPDTIDTVAFTRSRVEPMVRGLFSRAEHEAVLAVLAQSVVFVTSSRIEQLLFEQRFDRTAWTLANLYLVSLGAELLGHDAPEIVGFSEETTCFVTPLYFAEEDPFAGFIVHEAAHIFHNCKRATIGLRETRTRTWLLPIEFRMRETFAYSCEAYSRILQRGQGPAHRHTLAEEFNRSVRISDARAGEGEVARIVRAAAASRNGWKVILAECTMSVRTKRPNSSPSSRTALNSSC